MSDRNPGRVMASELHRRHLKALGFRKEGGTFWRGRTGHVELFNIQGSSWNSAGQPWSFYLNVRVRFADVGPPAGETGDRYWHADGRSERIVPDTPHGYELTAANQDQVIDDLAACITAASAALPALLPRAHARALAGFSSPLPVPDTWKD